MWTIIGYISLGLVIGLGLAWLALHQIAKAVLPSKQDILRAFRRN